MAVTVQFFGIIMIIIINIIMAGTCLRVQQYTYSYKCGVRVAGLHCKALYCSAHNIYSYNFELSGFLFVSIILNLAISSILINFWLVD